MAKKKEFKFKAKNGEEFVFSEVGKKSFKTASKKEEQECKNQKPVMEVFSWNPT